MALVMTDDKHYKNIANAIRNGLANENTYSPEEMAAGVDSVYTKGKSDGDYEGYIRGHLAGVEEGMKAQYDDFWDAYQQNGTRENYSYAFAGAAWNDETFKPKYPIGYGHSDFYAIFDYATSITTIPVPINVQTWDIFPYSFLKTISLREIRFDGIIGQDISFADSPLSKDSITNIIEHLSGTESGRTLTLKKSAVQKAFETSEGANDGNTSDEWLAFASTKSNWTITLA